MDAGGITTGKDLPLPIVRCYLPLRSEPRENFVRLGYQAPRKWIRAGYQRPCDPLLPSILVFLYRFVLASFALDMPAEIDSTATGRFRSRVI